MTERGSRIVVRDKPKPFWWSPAGLRPKPYEHDGIAGVLLYNQNGALFGWTPTAIAAERPAERAAEAA